MSKSKIQGIYKITCIPNNKVYIGMSNDIHTRWSAHKSRNATTPSHERRGMIADIEKYGYENFRFEVLEVIENPAERMRKEIEYINQYRSYMREFGYNRLGSFYIDDENENAVGKHWN